MDTNEKKAHVAIDPIVQPAHRLLTGIALLSTLLPGFVGFTA